MTLRRSASFSSDVVDEDSELLASDLSSDSDLLSDRRLRPHKAGRHSKPKSYYRVTKILHPPPTDFGPTTLTSFLQRETERAKLLACGEEINASYRPNGKGKEREVAAAVDLGHSEPQSGPLLLPGLYEDSSYMITPRTQGDERFENDNVSQLRGNLPAESAYPGPQRSSRDSRHNHDQSHCISALSDARHRDEISGISEITTDVGQTARSLVPHFPVDSSNDTTAISRCVPASHNHTITRESVRRTSIASADSTEAREIKRSFHNVAEDLGVVSVPTAPRQNSSASLDDVEGTPPVLADAVLQPHGHEAGRDLAGKDAHIFSLASSSCPQDRIGSSQIGERTLDFEECTASGRRNGRVKFQSPITRALPATNDPVSVAESSPRPRKSAVSANNLVSLQVDAAASGRDVLDVMKPMSSFAHGDPPMSSSRATTADRLDEDIHPVNRAALQETQRSRHQPHGHTSGADASIRSHSGLDDDDSDWAVVARQGIASSFMPPSTAGDDDEEVFSDTDEDSDAGQQLLSRAVTKRGSTINTYVTNSSINPRVFDYTKVVPEPTPSRVPSTARVIARHGREDEAAITDNGSSGAFSSSSSPTDTNVEPETLVTAEMRIPMKNLPRKWQVCNPSMSTLEPLVYARQGAGFWDGPSELPTETWEEIASYLSSGEVRSLRLVNKLFARALGPVVLRSCVAQFGKSFFYQTPWFDGNEKKTNLPAPASMLEKYRNDINKFGLSFEYDFHGLASAQKKVNEEEVVSWFAAYNWPIAEYQHFPALQEIENLVDNNKPLLKDAFRHLIKTSELGLCVDSGHGWLNGPDISDMALYKQLSNGGGAVFGKAFSARDIWHAFAINQYFRWAQENSKNETIKELESKGVIGNSYHIDRMRLIRTCDIDDFIVQQPDYKPGVHTGRYTHVNVNNIMGQPPVPPVAPAPQAPAPAPVGQGLAAHAPPPVPHAAPGGARARLGRNHRPAERRDRRRTRTRAPRASIPQWPLVFSCHNIAADVGGYSSFVRKKLPSPSTFPILPGHLEEQQAQWLMETAWAQRAFLSAYTTAVIVNQDILKNIHTLRISKISSGLLSSLAQREFWAALRQLRTLEFLVSPDWRQELKPNDELFQTNMLISPIEASVKTAEFLREYIAGIEALSDLTIGFVGGGEHATGLFARNQHVLPAPITTVPKSWVTDHANQPPAHTMIKLDHIKTLKFVNCWFSPVMLKQFMAQSRGSSLRNLTLESVSLTGKHVTNTTGALTTFGHGLRCEQAAEDWLHEVLPTDSACWTEVLDNITPGRTILDEKYAAGMIDRFMHPRPEIEYRGNVKSVALKSCGYVTISGMKSDEFSQHGLVVHSRSPMDDGLRFRKRMLGSEKWEDPAIVAFAAGIGPNGIPAGVNMPTPIPQTEIKQSNSEKKIMMSMTDPSTNMEWFGLGTLTECVHPIEKSVLEGMWGVSFGWGNDIERWAAVEDGCFEGGTGRFSGVLEKDDAIDDTTG